MDDVIILSSDSSAPNSPKDGICENENRNSDDTEIYYTQSIEKSELTVNEKSAVTTDCTKSDTANLSLREVLSENKISVNQESDAESDILADLPPVNFLEETGEGKNTVKNRTFSSKIHELSDSDDSSELIQKHNACQVEDKTDYTKQSQQNVPEKGRKRGRSKNAASTEERERKKAERLEKQAEKARDKALKQATNEALRSKKPEECIKYVKVCLDQNLLSYEFGGEILTELQAAGMQCNIQTNSITDSILWTRETLKHSVGEDLKLNVEKSVKEENEVIIMWKWEKVIEFVKNGDFLSQVQAMQTVIPGKTITLVIYGSKEYFRYQKNSKRREVRANILGNESRPKTNKKEAHFKNMPLVSEDDWELAVTEMQLLGFQHVMLDSGSDMAVYVRQFTKAVAEASYKREKQEQDLGDVDWYGEGDSRDCVRVDKNGNGLLRLWQQQLCQFNNVGLETSQAIAAMYGSPAALIRAYDNCSTEHEAQLLLASIPVRRGIGPLTSTRSVGPELSKKIYAFFTSIDEKPSQ